MELLEIEEGNFAKRVMSKGNLFLISYEKLTNIFQNIHC